MKINETIGIDVSKLKIDVLIHSNQMFEIFENTNKGFKKMVNMTYKNSKFPKEEILFAFEHTGLYSHKLSVYLSEKNIPFVIIPGLEIKKSLGIVRGKDDSIDAKRIALYAYRLRDELEPCKLPATKLMELKRLLALRELMVKQRAGYKALLKEQTNVLIKKDNKILFETQEKMIHYLTKQIDITEQEMDSIIKSEEKLNEMFQLITSIRSVGTQTALHLIVYTSGFTKFNKWRKFASYCGIAPFPNTSGTSIKGRTKISNLANKKIKSLLDMCAKSAIQFNPEMKSYYERRVEAGKNKRSTINVIRNKLLARIFAVVERKTPYVDFMKYAA